MSKRLRLPVLLLASVAPFTPARADTLSWLGAISPSWFTGGNWSSGTPPTAADTAAIDGGAGDMPAVEAPGAVAGTVGVGAITTGATLTVGPGGGLTTGAMNIGVAAIAGGAVIVTGPGSLLKVDGDLNVGLYGAGNLSVLAGGTATTGTSTLGGFDGANGTAIVSGSNSIWTFTTARIGNYGTGDLTVSDGGAASGTTAWLGSFNSGNGSTTITGAGSSLTLTGELVVGYAGIGTLKVLEGATAASSSVSLGYSTGAQGTATVSGSGSTLKGTDLLVGAYGTGKLDIAAGGAAQATTMVLGAYVGGAGTMTVDGTGSRLSADTLVAGNFGTGALSVSGGATVEAKSVTLGSEVGSVGTFALRGTGSSLTASDSLVVGRYGTGSLTIADGASVSVGTGGGGTLVVAAEPGAGGTVNIGAAVGEAAAAAGTLKAANLAFGAGTGRLNFNITDADHVFATNISGAGAVSVAAGSVALTGANTYSGGTSVAAGATLAGSVTSFGTGAIAADGTFILRQDADAALANVLNGSGVFAKEGTGTVTVATVNGFTGATQVRAGTLAVNGALAASRITVESGATLSGTGVVGGIEAKSGAILTPGGGSVGTLAVTGDVVQRSGSLYAVQVGSSGADRIAAAGAATVETGTLLTVTNASGSPYAVDARYAVLTADGGVTGTYLLNGDTRVSTFYTLAAENDGQAIYLASTQTRAYTDAAATANQRATASALQRLPEGNPTRDAVGAQQTDRAARLAFNLLSGEAYASTKTVLLDDSRFVRDASLDRVRTALGGEGRLGAEARCIGEGPKPGNARIGDCPAVWAQGFGSWGSHDGNGNAAGLTRTTGGLFMGADAALAPGVRAGLVAGYARTTFAVDARASSEASDNYSIGAYGGGQWGGLGLRGGTAYTFSDVAMDRNVAFPGLAQILSSGHGVTTAQVFGEAGYRFGTAASGMEPFAGLSYVNLSSGRFTETGGSAALVSGGGNDDVTYSTLGLRASSTFLLAGHEVRAGGMAGWRHAFGDITPQATLAFLGGGPFTVAGVPLAADVGVVEADISAALSRTMWLTLSYAGQFGTGFQDQSVRGNIAARF